MPGAELDTGEFALIADFFRDLDQGAAVALGNGDDAAVLALAPGEHLAVSVDSMLEGVHFPPRSPGDRVAYRAVAAAASDLAAMGARPLAMTLALSLPAVDEQWLSGCRSGLREAGADFALPLIGGDLVRGPLSLTVQVLGAVAPNCAITRSGARPGDALYVSGSLGDAAAGLAILQGRLTTEQAPPQRYLLERFWRPTPELELGAGLVSIATAAIDVSDGLLADVAHLASASGVRILVDSQRIPLSDALRNLVPRRQALEWALSGGEDFRLCFTAAPGADLPPECVMIGSVEHGSGVSCDAPMQGAGFVHF